MKQMRPYILLGLTLVVGFAAGFLTNGYLLRHRLDGLRAFVEHQQRFEQRILADLQLAPETEAAVTPILHAHFQRVRSLHREFRQDMRGEFASLREELASHLSPEEMQQLHRNLQRRGPKGMHRERHGRKHKFPHQPPPN